MSNESVAAELRKLQAKWRTAEWQWEGRRESAKGCNACAAELEPLIAQLEAPTMTPTMADEIMAKRIKEECWDPDCETFDLAHCQALVGLHRMTPDPALEELRKAARNEALREVENAISYFFDTHKGTINTNVACDTLLGRVKALAKFSQPSGQPAPKLTVEQGEVETVLVQMEIFASDSVGTRTCRYNVGEFARRLRAALAGQP